MLHRPVFVWVLGLVALQAFEQLFHVQYLEQLHRLLLIMQINVQPL